MRVLLPARRGFSLVELLTVVAIITVLLGLFLMAVLRSRETATSLACKDNLRQIGLATSNFVSARGISPFSKSVEDDRGMVNLLPYLEQQALYDQYKSASAEDRQNIVVPPVFHCQTEPEPWPTHLTYIPCGGTSSRIGSSGNPQLTGIFSPEIRNFAQVTDGLSNTVFYSERLSLGWEWPDDFSIALKRYPVMVNEFVSTPEEFDSVCWANAATQDVSLVSGAAPIADLGLQYPFGTRNTPNSTSCVYSAPGLFPPDSQIMSGMETYTVSSHHDGYVNVALGDGSVRTVSNEIERAVWMAAGTVNGKEMAIDW